MSHYGFTVCFSCLLNVMLQCLVLRYKAVNSGIVKDPKAFYWPTTPSAFGTQAELICGFNQTGMAAFGPQHAVRPADIPFQCLDITYAYRLLVDGLGFNPKQVRE